MQNKITADRPISQSLEEWEAEREEGRPLPPGMTQQSLFEGVQA